MALTRKEIRRRFYLRHKDRVIHWVRSYEERRKNDPKWITGRKEFKKKWEAKNYNKRRQYKTLWQRVRGRKRQIKHHKWYCKIHKVWVEENSNCPFCEAEFKNLIRKY